MYTNLIDVSFKIEMIFGDGCWHPDSILTLTVFQSRQFSPLPGHTLNICYTPCKFSDIYVAWFQY